MKQPTRIIVLLSAGMICALGLSLAPRLTKPALAGCGAGVSWQVWNQIDSRSTVDTSGGASTTTASWSSRSEQSSSVGENYSDVQTLQTHADGSSSSHEEMSYSDPNGQGCDSDGEPWSGRRTLDEDTDPRGNRKRHIEEYIKKNGKCMKWVKDTEWDSRGNVVKETESETEVPCSKYVLEIALDGSMSLPGEEITWGPNKAPIYLESKEDNNYQGSYEGVFDSSFSGECVGEGTFPVRFEVAGKEDEFGELEFDVTATMAMSISMACESGAGTAAGPSATGTITVVLPQEDGASKSISTGPVTYTFTLRKQKP